MEKSILVMSDPRPTVVPGLLGLLTRRNFSLIARASQSILPLGALVRLTYK